MNTSLPTLTIFVSSIDRVFGAIEDQLIVCKPLNCFGTECSEELFGGVGHRRAEEVGLQVGEQVVQVPLALRPFVSGIAEDAEADT